MKITYDLRTGTYTASYGNSYGYGETRPKAIVALLETLKESDAKKLLDIV